jgi:uncharacterized protein (DUF58 family)
VTATVRQRAAAELLDPAFLVRLAKLELNVRRLLSGDRRGDLPINRRGPGTHFRGHRAYAIGDDPRFLDWNAFLRLDDLLVKEFESEEAARLTILVDCSASMAVLDGSKILAALRIAAALGAIALARHGSVRVVPVPASREPSSFGGKNAMSALLAELSRFEAQGAARLMRAFQSSSPPGRRAGLVLVLSDFLSEDDFRAGLKFLRGRGNQVEALHVFTPGELAPGVDGMVELVDVETGKRVRERVRPDQVARYRAIVEAHFRDVAATCRGLGCGYHQIDASQPMEKLVLGFLESRALVT